MKTKKKTLKESLIIITLALLPIFSGCKIEELFSPRDEKDQQQDDTMAWSELEDIWASLATPNFRERPSEHVALIRRLGRATGQDLDKDDELHLRQEIIYTLLREAEFTSFSGNERYSQVAFDVEKEILIALGEQLKDTYRRNISSLARENSRYARLARYQNFMKTLIDHAYEMSVETETDDTRRDHIGELHRLADDIRKALREIERNRGSNNNDNGNPSNGSGNNSNRSGNSNDTSSPQSSENSDNPEE